MQLFKVRKVQVRTFKAQKVRLRNVLMQIGLVRNINPKRQCAKGTDTKHPAAKRHGAKGPYTKHPDAKCPGPNYSGATDPVWQTSGSKCLCSKRPVLKWLVAIRSGANVRVQNILFWNDQLRNAIVLNVMDQASGSEMSMFETFLLYTYLFLEFHRCTQNEIDHNNRSAYSNSLHIQLANKLPR